MNAFEIQQHNNLTSSKTRKTRALQHIRGRHVYAASIGQDPDNFHGRMIRHYDRELLHLGVPS